MRTHRLYVSGEVVLDNRERHDDLPHGHDELRGPEEDEEEVPPALLHLVRVVEAADGQPRHFFRGDLGKKNVGIVDGTAEEWEYGVCIRPRIWLANVAEDASILEKTM